MKRNKRKSFSRYLPALLLAAVLPVSVAAAMNGQGASVTTQAAPIRDITDLCQQLVTYQPDGSAEYVAGVDAYGRAVVPASGDAPDMAVLEPQWPLRIGITLDQARQFNLPPSARKSYTAEMFVGFVELHKDGSVTYNGKRLSSAQTMFLCHQDKSP